MAVWTGTPTLGLSGTPAVCAGRRRSDKLTAGQINFRRTAADVRDGIRKGHSQADGLFGSLEGE